MVSDTSRRIDFEDGRFIARFNDDPTIVAKLDTIQRCHWRGANGAWVIEPHWPSVRRLVSIVLELRFNITAAARDAIRDVEHHGESLEYSIDMIHDNQGSARFRCVVGDDDELRDKLKAIPGAYWEDEYWSVPTDWEHCCAPLREIVVADERFTLSPAAELLLFEEDVSHLHVRSAAPLTAARLRKRVLERAVKPVAAAGQRGAEPTPEEPRSDVTPEAPSNEAQSKRRTRVRARRVREPVAAEKGVG